MQKNKILVFSVIGVIVAVGLMYLLSISNLIKTPLPNPPSPSANNINQPPVADLVITFPTAGAVLKRGNTYEITWTGADLDAQKYSIYLYSGANGDTASPELLGEADTSSTSFSWTVANSVTPRKEYFIGFSGSKVAHNSPVFSIVSQ